MFPREILSFFNHNTTPLTALPIHKSAVNYAQIMPNMALKPTILFPILLVALIFLARPTHAFGAGNIADTSKIAGQNWRHGDIEDTLLTLITARVIGRNKKFSKLDVKRVYFGNWLRDYSQAIDVGTVKYVSADAIRLLLWVLGFMSFGYGTGEFEVTSERLGCYRPEEHIDNPKDYADNIDARQYHRALRGPVDERRELGIDERNGMKNYIASEDLGITTSSGLVRNLFGQAIDLGRKYKDSKDEKDFYEALRLLGTGCHCLEDFSAHSNYTELALIELGERDIFPHVGDRTQMQVQGARNPVFPIVTGTFGGVDFLHSVMGEFNDKATQSELEELEGAISHAKNSDTSLLKDILSKVPSGVFGGNDDPSSKADELQANSNAAHMENMHISPKEPEEFTKQVNEIMKQIYPIIEFHDNIMKGISSAIDKIPILPDIIEQLQDQLNLFVFSLLAPYIMPIISQVKNELHTGSSEVIKSSQDHQMAVFSDDSDTNPTHSMLSKDHFSNVLNEPAGKVASAVLKWVVPQIVECWDDDNADIARTLDRIVNGVLHHPTLREYGNDGARDGRGLMFREVEKWWGEKSDRERDSLRRSLSKDGVQHFKNHKEGVKDKGHGCGKPLGLPTKDTYESSGATGGKSSDAGNLLGGIASALGNSSGGSGSGGGYGNSKHQDQISDKVSEAVGGGAIGSIVGGFASNILGNAAKSSEKKSNQSSGYGQNDSYNQSGNSYGSNQPSSGYGQNDSYNSSHQGGNSYGSQQQSSGYGQDNSYNSSGYQAPQSQGGYSNPAAQYGQTQGSSAQYASGGRNDEYEQDSNSGRTGYGSQHSSVTRPSYEGRHDQASERRHESDNLLQNTSFGGRTSDNRRSHQNSSRRDDSDDDDSNDDDDYEKKQRKREKKEQKKLKKQREEEEKRSSRRDDDNYPAHQPQYGQEQNYSSGYSHQSESSYSQSSRYEQTTSSSQGTSRYEESSSSGYPGNTHSSSSRYESSTPSYGGISHSSSEYPGNVGRTSGGYGNTTSGYGGDSQASSGYGGNANSSSGEYGSSASGYGNESRHHGSSDRTEGRGRGEEYGNDSSDMPGSFGGDESYGEDRRRNDGGGYGRNSGGYGSRY
jgi:hypothetical protein